MSSDKSVSKNTPGSPWFSTPDAAPAKNLKEIELSLSSISDSSSHKRKKLRFLASNYTYRDRGEEENKEVNSSIISSVQQGLELFPGDHEEEQSSSQEVPPLYTSLSRETSFEIELMRQSHPKNYSRTKPNTSTRKFFTSKEVSPEPFTSQIRKRPQNINKKKFAEGSLYSLHMPLGWMAVHGIDEEIWEELQQEYP